MRIVLGFGPFSGHTLAEVPDETLKELSRRFPLESDKCDLSEPHSLLFTVAIHEEIRRREAGGLRAKRIPTPRELASQMVAKGFQHLSKTHHPDRNGSSEAQVRLNNVRSLLLQACTEIPDDDQEALSIPAEGPELSDDDIPF
jgi:hypothetical protein